MNEYSHKLRYNKSPKEMKYMEKIGNIIKAARNKDDT